ncbi:MAG: hypothetical protein NWE89_00830 [Candidatus Bathyarchaeota archaeon]|nr:hypothetical protein [Candidatus Bathyarchaeota archaeon]
METKETLAKAVTLVFNAPLLAVLTYLYIYEFNRPEPSLSLLGVATFFSGVLPVLIILYMKRSGIVHDMMVERHEDRIKPFIGAIVSYLLGIIALVYLRAPIEMLYLMACYTVNSLVMMLITLRYKVSIHAAGIAGPATFLVHQYSVSLWPFTILAAVVCWARYELDMHSLGQLTLGLILSALLTYAQLELYSLFIPLL